MNASLSGSGKEPIHVACLKVCHISSSIWDPFLSYLRSRIGSTKSLKTLKGITRKIKVTGYTFQDKLPDDINFTLVLLCGYASTCRSEPRGWIEGLKSLPEELQVQERYLDVVLCMGSSTVVIGEGDSQINVLSFGIDGHVMAFQRESKSLVAIKKALIKQLE